MADSLAALVPWMQARAARLDQDAAFPDQELARLRACQALSPFLPAQSRTRSDRAADALAETLILCGQGNLSVGRLVEAHINALQLLARYRGPVRTSQEQNQLYGLWVTDPPANGLRMHRVGGRVRLTGGKQFCSGAGHVTAAVVTAEDEDGGVRMLTVRMGAGETATPLSIPMHGMRAALTGAVDFNGCEVSEDDLLGEPGDYLKEPDFSAGAWRGSAVALGGLVALVDFTTAQLRASGRLDSPHTQARLGQMMIARETCRLWVRSTARIAEDPGNAAGHKVATVGLARIAVETACLDAMRLAQRSIGLSSFRVGSPVERLCRDLATYLRQPAPDEVLVESGVWFADNPTGAL